MLATFIAYAVAIAVAALVLSLPLGKSQPARMLRRVSAFFGVLAILPALVASIISPHGATGSGGPGCALAGIGILIVASVVAWAVLAVRSASTRGGTSKRLALKRPYQHRADPDLISIIRERMQGPRDDA
ncbi:MAG: hypothetical protein NDJ92_20990 [Thermoanaerobaculia bacterium]|nr:hypothetical protein [Thermoanaerobaculia bacterium]